MNDIDRELLEQLSAWIDGELPPDQARFLQRRLDADPALRAQFERWQLASACLRGQPVAAMPSTLAPAIAAAVAREPRRRAPWPWIATAAVLVLVAVLLPGRPPVEPGPPALAEAPSASPVVAPATSPVGPADAVSPDDALVAFAPDDAGAASPLPSIGDFPLAESGDRPWPRSPLATGPQELEAYLVGHNTLMAEDGLGGFMPYVDVVASDDAAHDADAAEAAADVDAIVVADDAPAVARGGE